MQNSQNTRRNVYITWNGVTMCRSEWARRLGVNPNTVGNRVFKGWTELEALGLVEKTK
jgi:Mn-dependent DtxR family transcriptional regulator